MLGNKAGLERRDTESSKYYPKRLLASCYIFFFFLFFNKKEEEFFVFFCFNSKLQEVQERAILPDIVLISNSNPGSLLVSLHGLSYSWYFGTKSHIAHSLTTIVQPCLTIICCSL